MRASEFGGRQAGGVYQVGKRNCYRIRRGDMEIWKAECTANAEENSFMVPVLARQLQVA